MKANSKRTQARLSRIQLSAITEVEKALEAGEISIESAEVISRYSENVQRLMLAETVRARPKPTQDKKVTLMPGLAEKKAHDQAADERIEEAMRFEVM
jgi:hypothetical protein